jgi:putative heme-binding domain-containing protein
VPEIATSRVLGETAVPGKASVKQAALKEGPTVHWIWGESQNQRYFLRTEFEGGSASAWLKATCDNRLRLYLNGRRVARSDNWQEPVEVDVQPVIRAGANVLVAEVENTEGPAGFALKLALIMPDGSRRYVVSDASWKASLERGGKDATPVKSLGAMGQGTWKDVFAESAQASAARDVFQVLPGFQVELLYTVPRETLGSWVAITFDPKGRLIASDQEAKGLCRITPPPIGSDQPTKVEHLDAKISSAQGLLCAFDSLYVMVNGANGGLYRVRDTDGNDQYDQVTFLSPLKGAGEHGPHALRLSPDGKSIVAVGGNFTPIPEHIKASEVPRNWSEDLLLPRDWDGNGFARGVLAPGGWVARTDPDGKSWELMSIGYRNSYDMDYNADGELFVYDSDMEWDYGMPWYRATRVCHATSGSEFGWRSGTGVWPAYFADSLPPTLDIGPGSPVGVAFGYGTKFPAKYQKALFILDWTFGTMYAIHLEPDGASYKAVKEEFVSRTPLPLTDVAVGPDGALYFTIGGRGTQSALYRVTYTGKEPTGPTELHEPRFANLRALRHQLEALHRPAPNPSQAVGFILPNLGHADRFIRYAARVALEHQDAALWQESVLAGDNPDAVITGIMALARQGKKSLQPRAVAALERLDFGQLNPRQKLDLLRALSLVFIRMEPPDAATAARLARQFDAFYPARDEILDRELVNMLVYLKSPTLITKTVALMKEPRETKSSEMAELLARNPSYGGTITQMFANQPDAQKIHYAFALRNLRDGWTLDQRKFYFEFFKKARKWSGGASYLNFIINMDNEAFENATDAERLAIEASGAREPFRAKALPKPHGPGHAWTLDELVGLSRTRMTGRNLANGQRAFAAARCVVCHRFGGDGGATGPDLTQVAGRFGFKDLAEAVIDPNKVVSDQYRAFSVATNSGKVYTGKIVSETDKAMTMLVDPEDPTKVVEIPKDDVESSMPSKTSLMPEKLFDSLNENEVLDLLAYLLSRGNPDDPMFQKK